MFNISPLRMAVLYFIMGMFFTYLAINSVSDSSWNVLTYIFAGIATLEFGVAIRALRIHFHQKHS